ncbi:MAG TPA: acyltransferase family protein [Polyangiaceae bacterium]
MKDAAPTSVPKYRLDVDGLRAIAVLAVFAFHLRRTSLPGGFCGVDVFFIISGFVVARSLLGAEYMGFPAFTKWFYARRAKRILPALIVSLLGTALVPSFFMPGTESHRALTMGFAALFGVSNLRALQAAGDYFGADAELDPFTHTWSLGVEEQFYFVFPLLLVLLTLPHRHGRILATSCTLIKSTSLGLLLICSFVGSFLVQRTAPTWAFHMMPTRFWELGLGVLLAVNEGRISSHVTGEHRSPVSILYGVAVIAVGVFGFTFPASEGRFPVPLACPSVVFAASAIWLGTARPDSFLPKALSHPLLVYIGKRSYSLYLWHWPIIVGLRWTTGLDQPLTLAIAVATAFGAAELSYRYVEQPARRTKLATTGVFTRAAMAVGCAALLLGILIWPARERLYLGRSGTGSDWAWLDVSIQLGDKAWSPEQCAYETNGDAGREPNWGSCTFRARTVSRSSKAPNQLFFLGNSFAHASIPMLRELLDEEVQLAVTAIVAWGCHPSSSLTAQPAWRDSCDYYTREVIPRLFSRLTKGDLVMLVYDTSPLTNDGPYANGDTLQRLRVNEWSRFLGNPTTPSLRRELVREWLVDLASIAAKRGASVIFQAPTPLTRGTNPRRCQVEWFRPAHVASSLCPTLSHQEQLRLREPVMSMLAQVRSASFNFYIFDPFDAICPGDRCEWFQDSRPVWRDDCHLAEWKAESLGTVFQHFLMSNRLLSRP